MFKSAPKVLGMPSLGDEPKNDEPFIPEGQIAKQVDVIASNDVRVEVTVAKGLDEGQKEVDKIEGTQILLVVTVKPIEKEAKKEKVDTKVEKILVARDTDD